MLFQKLNKVQNTSQQRTSTNSHARHNLEIFTQLRSVDKESPDSSLTEDEIIQALDQELFKDNMEFKRDYSA